MNIDSKSHHSHEEVMVVEDDISDRKFMSEILTEAGYKVRPAGDGELALRSVQALHPDLILLDFQLPGMDGVEVCRRLKDDPATRDIPVIFVSARGDDGLKVRALDAGAIDYMTKPLVSVEVLARVRTHLRVYRLQRKLVDRTRELAAEIEDRKRATASAARYSYVLESSLNEIYLFAAESLRFVEVNRGARENLGYSREEILKLTPLDIKPEFTQAEFSRAIDVLRTGEQELVHFKTVHRRKDGSLYPVDVFLQFMRGDPPVFVAVILDITEREQAENELTKHREHLEELVQERTEDLRRAVALMAGREVRMAEMKREIHSLREQAKAAGQVAVQPPDEE